MKSKTVSYIIVWCLLVGLFNIVCFVTPDELFGVDKYSGAFWPGYIFITISFVLHLIFNVYMLSARSKNQQVMNVPLIIISFGGLAVMMITGTVCMILPNLANWVGIIICYFVLAVSVGFIVSAGVVGANVNSANAKLNEKTFDYRLLIDDAQILVQKAGNNDVKQCAKDVYEAIRYSDLISCPELYTEEQEIKKKLNELLLIIADDDKAEEIKAKSRDLLSIISIRNNKCKTLKRRK